MSGVSAKIKSSTKKGQLMPKPRMTQNEKAFFERVNAIVFNPAMVRNGVRYLNTNTFNALPEATQKRYLDLTINKTR